MFVSAFTFANVNAPPVLAPPVIEKRVMLLVFMAVWRLTPLVFLWVSMEVTWRCDWHGRKKLINPLIKNIVKTIVENEKTLNAKI